MLACPAPQLPRFTSDRARNKGRELNNRRAAGTLPVSAPRCGSTARKQGRASSRVLVPPASVGAICTGSASRPTSRHRPHRMQLPTAPPLAAPQQPLSRVAPCHARAQRVDPPDAIRQRPRRLAVAPARLRPVASVVCRPPAPGLGRQVRVLLARDRRVLVRGRRRGGPGRRGAGRGTERVGARRGR